ncbi:unnamed protein product [Haemonchus placei]|uniref:G protein-coupled receptor n=1 Tax=Haemonchus placei TaxID=6290 RepID=A0A0N4X0Q7_HAEPC|nr:unnamed protein product [Haemonchus placei]
MHFCKVARSARSRITNAQVSRKTMTEVVLLVISFIFRYGEFGGFQSTEPNHGACALMSFSIVTASPILILYLRRLTLRTLKSFRQYSESTKQSSKMFLKVNRSMLEQIFKSYLAKMSAGYKYRNRFCPVILPAQLRVGVWWNSSLAFTVQAMVPICCFVTTASLGIFAKISGSEIALIEYLLLAVGALPCVIDPLIAIYFVPSYRAWVKKKLCSRLNSRKVETRSTTDSTRIRTTFIVEGTAVPVSVS